MLMSFVERLFQLASSSKTVTLTFGLVIATCIAPNSTRAQLDPAPEKLVVMSWNVEWMFDNDKSDNRSDLSKQQSAPSAEYWAWKVESVADAIAKTDATIVALQEIEGERTLADIAKVLREKHKLTYRPAFIQGSDNFTEQDVGILQRTGLSHFRRQEQSKAMFDSGKFYNLSKHIVAEFRWDALKHPLTILNTHVRATAEAEAERTRQGRLARYFLEPSIVRGDDVIILGDLNSEHPVGDLAGEMKEIIEGMNADSPKMVDLLQFVKSDSRRTHLILDKQFDRIVVTQSLMEDAQGEKDWVFSKIEIRPDLNVRGKGPDAQEHWDNRLTMSTTELDVSDHHPVVATFELR